MHCLSVPTRGKSPNVSIASSITNQRFDVDRSGLQRRHSDRQRQRDQTINTADRTLLRGLAIASVIKRDYGFKPPDSGIRHVRTGNRQSFRCAQLGCRVGGPAVDQNKIRDRHLGEFDNGARHGEVVQSD